MRLLNRAGEEVPEEKLKDVLSWKIVVTRGDVNFQFLSVGEIIERYLSDPGKRAELNEYFFHTLYEKLDSKLDRQARVQEIDGG